mmetsp:Transcript_23697/g.43384  ORF Transcript_23697/g.43384 Transcript_23697/m.43384 type:complete len:153 (+) Transcript_23697:104-562(+)
MGNSACCNSDKSGKDIDSSDPAIAYEDKLISAASMHEEPVDIDEPVAEPKPNSELRQAREAVEAPAEDAAASRAEAAECREERQNAAPDAWVQVESSEASPSPNPAGQAEPQGQPDQSLTEPLSAEEEARKRFRDINLLQEDIWRDIEELGV